MPMYALGILPLIKFVATPGATEASFVDDSGSGGKLLFDWRWSLTSLVLPVATSPVQAITARLIVHMRLVM